MSDTVRADIELVESESETTLYIGGDQAMQAWERDLMWASADLLCQHGSRFYEIGLGLGLSALRIATNPGTESHTVLELHQKVIDLFRERHPDPPLTLHIECGDFFSRLHELPDAGFDGMLFDPSLDLEVWHDAEVWRLIVPEMVRVLRLGGVLIPFFSTTPELRWQYLPYFRRIMVERHTFTAYENTSYTHGRATGRVIVKVVSW
jgi:SAM-dependent methyltransferase